MNNQNNLLQLHTTVTLSGATPKFDLRHFQEVLVSRQGKKDNRLETI